jgi:hypothetical protein
MLKTQYSNLIKLDALSSELDLQSLIQVQISLTSSRLSVNSIQNLLPNALLRALLTRSSLFKNCSIYTHRPSHARLNLERNGIDFTVKSDLDMKFLSQI